MDKKALKILFDTYWSSKGWKPESEQVTPDEAFLYAKRAGVMFDPERISHDEIIRRALQVVEKINDRVVADAFLSSLSSRRLELESSRRTRPSGRASSTCSVTAVSYESPTIPVSGIALSRFGTENYLPTTSWI